MANSIYDPIQNIYCSFYFTCQNLHFEMKKNTRVDILEYFTSEKNKRIIITESCHQRFKSPSSELLYNIIKIADKTIEFIDYAKYLF